MESLSASYIMLGLLFGCIGFGFFTYGKKQKKKIPLISGIGLMALPYILQKTLPITIISIILCILPFIIKDQD